MKLYEAITADNWAKRVMHYRARACLIGHIIGCYPDSGRREAIYRDLTQAIAAVFPGRSSSIGAFNDHPDTTLEDILRVCKLADI